MAANDVHRKLTPESPTHPAPPTDRGLYLITGPELHPGRLLIEVVEEALDAGAVWLQYRDKLANDSLRRRRAERLRVLCDRYTARLIINDSPELALECGADGVHLGREDPDPASVRSRVGARMLIGVSCYDSLERAQSAVQSGADYIAFGSFFASPSKPQAARADPVIMNASKNLAVPRVAIGGILPDNGAALIAAGADLLAVISGVFAQADIAAATRAYVSLFDERARC